MFIMVINDSVGVWWYKSLLKRCVLADKFQFDFLLARKSLLEVFV